LAIPQPIEFTLAEKSKPEQPTQSTLTTYVRLTQTVLIVSMSSVCKNIWKAKAGKDPFMECGIGCATSGSSDCSKTAPVPMCAICGSHPEGIMHVLLHCNMARVARFTAPSLYALKREWAPSFIRTMRLMLLTFQFFHTRCGGGKRDVHLFTMGKRRAYANPPNIKPTPLQRKVLSDTHYHARCLLQNLLLRPCIDRCRPPLFLCVALFLFFASNTWLC